MSNEHYRHQKNSPQHYQGRMIHFRQRENNRCTPHTLTGPRFDFLWTRLHMQAVDAAACIPPLPAIPQVPSLDSIIGDCDTVEDKRAVSASCTSRSPASSHGSELAGPSKEQLLGETLQQMSSVLHDPGLRSCSIPTFLRLAACGSAVAVAVVRHLFGVTHHARFPLAEERGFLLFRAGKAQRNH